MGRGGEAWEGEITKENTETWESDTDVYYLGCDDGFKYTYKYQNLSNYVLNNG